MKRPVLVGLLAASVVALIGLILSMRSIVPKDDGQAAQAKAAARELTVTLDKESFDLRNGVAEKPAAPDSAAMNTVRIVGEPVAGDADGNGNTDAALLISNDSGGSGTFYYAVVAVNHGDGSFHASNALPLGDRITPEGIELRDGRFVYRFMERKPGESMATSPSVDKRVTISVDPVLDKISAS